MLQMQKGTMTMGINGLGTDIIEIDRFRQSMERHGIHFLNRILTEKEQHHCMQFRDAAPHFAGRFAAKEAIAKALGTGIGKALSWHDIEILPDEHGKPIAHLSKEAKSSFNNPHILVSISHCHSYATAVAVCSG